MRILEIKKLNLYALLLILASLVACQSNSKPKTSTATSNKPNSSYSSSSTPSGYHRVQRGENLYRISLKYNTTVANLSRLNNISDAGQIEVGQLIKVPGRKSAGYSKPSSSTSSSSSAPKPTANNQAIAKLDFGWPVNGNVISNYNGSTNKGIDIRTQSSTSVKAAQSGKVIYSDYVSGYGHLILISHNASNSILTAYGNNKDVVVKMNQQVKKGEVIAKQISNDSNQPVLHFEIRSNGVAVNPIGYLK